jgi:hypothetical protein
MTKHPVTGVIWEHEHGPQGGDEINIVKKGANYGWPVATMELIMTTQSLVTFSKKRRYSRSGILLGTIDCPSGMAFISSDIYPKWEFTSRLSKVSICRNAFTGDKITGRQKIATDVGRLRTFCKVLMATFTLVEGKGISKIT